MITTYMRIAGIPGRTSVADYNNLFEVYSFAWHETHAVAQSGGGGGAGKPVSSTFAATLEVGSGSPAMMVACANGHHFNLVEFFAFKQDGDKPILAEYYSLGSPEMTYFGIADSNGASAGLSTVEFSVTKFEMGIAYTNADGRLIQESGKVTF